MLHSNTHLAVLGNLIEQRIIEIPFVNDVDLFLLNFIKKNQHQLLSEELLKDYESDFTKKVGAFDRNVGDEFWKFVAEDFFDYNKVNDSIKQYLLSIPIEQKHYEALEQLNIDVNNPLYSLIIPNWDGETPKDFLIENWEGIEFCLNVEKVVIDGIFVNKKASYSPFGKLSRLKSIVLRNGKFNDLEKLLHLSKLEEIVLHQSTFPFNAKTKKALGGYLDKGNSFLFDNYVIKDLSTFQSLLDLNKFLESRDYESALPIMNTLLETASDSSVQMNLLNQKKVIYENQLSRNHNPETINDLFKITEQLLGLIDQNAAMLSHDYNYRKVNALIDAGSYSYSLNHIAQASEFFEQGFNLALLPSAGVNEYNLSNLINCLVILNRKNEIPEWLDKYVVLYENNRGWGDSGMLFQWQTLLKYGYFEKGLNHLEKYLTNIYHKREIENLNNFMPLMSSLAPLLELQHANLSYPKSHLLVNKDDFYSHFCSFVSDLRKCFLNEQSLLDIRESEKYSMFLELYKV